MKRMILVLLASTLASPSLAQHSGHGQAAPAPAPARPPGPAQTCLPEHAAMGHCTMPAQAPVAAPTPARAQTCLPEHAAMGHCTLATPPASSAVSTDPHAGHNMGEMATNAPPVAPPPSEALSGPAHAADGVFGAEQMAAAREGIRAEHGGGRTYRFMVDQLEIGLRDGRDGYAWEDVQFWYGGDLNKLWLKSQGEGRFGEGAESVEVQALFSRAIAPFFDLQAGVRYDFRPRPDRAHLVLGIQGLAPYWFEIDAAAFLSEKGDVTARAEVEYDQRITQRLILQPRAEVDFSLQDVPELDIGAGLSTTELGLRLRYEIVPEFAPYVGVQYERAFGDTADFRRASGDDVGGWSFVLGVRAWF